jgi:hypothetical protein
MIATELVIATPGGMVKRYCRPPRGVRKTDVSGSSPCRCSRSMRDAAPGSPSMSSAQTPEAVPVATPIFRNGFPSQCRRIADSSTVAS